MKYLNLLFFLLLCCSCDYFDNKKLSSQDLYEEELEAFNWNAVDFYPTFSSCDSIIDKDETKRCFQNVLLDKVNTFLSIQRLVVSEDVSDTIVMTLTVDKTGLLSVNSIKIQPETTEQLPQIDSLLRESLKQLPKIRPAVKRNQEVTTVFELPVIVNIH